MSTQTKVGGFDTAVLIRRLLFFVVLFSLVLFYLIFTFRGLTTAHGMEQAQIGREIARGNGSATKVVRPASVWQIRQDKDADIRLKDMQDTYHSPLMPYIYGAVLKAVGGDEFSQFQMKDSEKTIYRLDRVISAISIILFLLAIGINYLLISRIFDVKIAGVTALLMALSDLMWKFTQTGLPQMLMLLLLSCAFFFIYRAVEASVSNRSAVGSVILAAIFLSLLALSHWLTLWIVAGFIIYAAFFLKPKGVSGLIVIGILALSCSFFVIKNLEWSNHPGGTAFLTLYGGLTESEASIMRTSDPSDETYRILYNLNSFLINTTSNFLKQVNQLYNNFGAILAAPLFFFALLHPFKRPSIAAFRWTVLLMWVVAALGMAIFGLSQDTIDPNNLHILFAPVMTAYGLAFFSILWSRLELPPTSAFMRYGHFVIIVAISAGPLLFSIPNEIRRGIAVAGKDAVWPSYWPQAFSSTLHNQTKDTDVIFSDQPWAVAWYADRRSIWLPRRVDEFEDLENLVQEQGLNTAGIVITPSSLEENPFYSRGFLSQKDDFASLYLDAAAFDASGGAVRPGELSARAQIVSDIRSTYPNVFPLYSMKMIYYSKNRVIQ